MRENARQRCCNGAPPPFGQRIAEAGPKGARVKKVLVPADTEGAIVRRIFALHLAEEGVPLVVKAIAARLNREGVRFRGRLFSTSSVHRVLTGESAAGTHYFTRIDSRTRRQKLRGDWVAMSVPPIVPRDMFDRVRESLARAPPTARRRAWYRGRLSGLAVCAGCGARMILRTGKGGRYRCTPGAGCALHGRSVCAGRRLPMDPLDAAVTEAVAEQVLRPERQDAIRAAFVSREAEGAKARLMRLVATGALDPEDAALVE